MRRTGVGLAATRETETGARTATGRAVRTVAAALAVAQSRHERSCAGVTAVTADVAVGTVASAARAARYGATGAAVCR